MANPDEPGTDIAALPRNWVNARLRPLRERARRVPRGIYVEAGFVALITLAALFLRTYDLSSLPSGVQGDEAITGLEAQRILDEGSIGLYSPLATGQPSGPLYLVALSVGIFGESAFAVRIVPALMGTATVIVLYAVARPFFGRDAALLGAAVLSVMGWHIHYARIGFPLEAWPLLVLVGAALLSRALQTNSTRWWLVSGAVTALGIYVYNTHPIVIITFGLCIVGFLMIHRYSPLALGLINVGWFVAAGLVVSLPMILYAADSSSGYFEHFERGSLTGEEGWKNASVLGRVDLVFDRYVDVWDRLVFSPELDLVDATGLYSIVPATLFVAALGGVALALAKQRNSLLFISVALLLVLPLASALALDALARRTFAMAPFMAMFAGVGLSGAVHWIRGLFGPPIRDRADVFVYSAVVPVLLFLGWQSFDEYFGEFRDDANQEWVFAAEFTEATRYIDSLPDGTFVYFFSQRHSFNYETREFLAQQAVGEDRSTEFGRNQSIDLIGGGAYAHAFVLVGQYRLLAADIAIAYPGGVTDFGDTKTGRPAFVSYFVTDEVARVGPGPTTQGAGAFPPNSPSNVVATPLSASQIQLTWAHTADGEQGFNFYVDGQGDWIHRESSPDVTRTVISALAPTTEYCYTVTAFGPGGESVHSDLACARTHRPP